ncbi:MAG: peptidoglycan-binding protein [Clostridia bacterium]|nr:peptidoglycan-binding protein [Clostridia bacterium]
MQQRSPAKYFIKSKIAAALLVCAFFCALPLIAGGTGEILTANTSLNLRSGPGTRHTSLLVLKSGAEMTKTGSSGDWYRVTYGKRTGFVRKNLVTAKGASTAPEAPTAPAASVASDATKPAVYRTLREGMTGEDVRLLQEALSNAGFMDTKPDGRFGPATKKAVTDYQRANKLKADGIAGEATQRKLLGDPAAPNTGTPAANASAANTPLVFAEPAPGSALRLGNKGETVRTLQTQLQTLGYLSGRVDGSFGQATEQAVMAFQRASKLKADGVAGNATQNAISAALAKRNGPVSVPTAADASTNAVLKEGSKNDTVKQMQTVLKNLGYFGGTVTGNFGPLTAEAVKAFQKNNSLKADGIAGPATLTKVFSGSAVANNKSGSSSSVSAAGSGPRASNVQHIGASTIRSRYKSGTVVTIYCFRTQLTWKCRFYSVGVHADSEPLTKTDTDTMFKAFGNKNTWTPKAVWVTMPDGKTYIASMHNMGHLSGSIKDNGFNGHLCIHFPRTMADAQRTGPYAVTHQQEIIRGWAETQAMAGR